MNTELNPPLYTRARYAPWREILRQRWSGRQDRALVLRDRGGLYHLSGSRQQPAPAPGALALDSGEPAREGTVARPRLFGHDSAYLVPLDEFPGTRTVAMPTHHGTESVDVQVLWWVHDPTQTVRSRTTHGWPAVRRDLDRRLRHLKAEYAAAGHGFGVPEMRQQLAVARALPECGLSYRATDVSAREGDTELRLADSDGAEPAYLWSGTSREEYDFCKRAVRDGPVSLAALWLVRHPDQVSQVLDWTVAHSGLLRGETTWQDEVAGLLGTLTAQERQELSALLRDRLGALGRTVPGQQGAGAGAEAPRPYANGWPGGVPQGRSV
ncbi:hypothetical protein [Streptomyces sp. NPDC057702]|uniref:hypothetical protein n=1 Tax=unclassified Streptomyces TaxID=2593676 RepID=UPI00369489FB